MYPNMDSLFKNGFINRFDDIPMQNELCIVKFIGTGGKCDNFIFGQWSI